MQVVLHAVAPQVNGAQATGAAGGQTPRPLHTRAAVAPPAVQAAGAHSVLAACRRQPPRPLQVPSRWQPAAGSAGQWLPGSCPAGTAVQVPAAPGRLQAKQGIPQAVEQQTPSMHWFEAHSPAAVQVCPVGRLTWQVPPEQKNPAWHCVASVQRVPHEAPMQTLGAQLRLLPAMQVPLPSQLRAPCSVAPVQLPGTHWVPAG
jgi:hypothetical protein